MALEVTSSLIFQTDKNETRQIAIVFLIPKLELLCC